ncbi:Hypothetical predicted protein [Marmota monax]|uniref:Uncharacterized protein n=1 Tax=Marmota monax TaxID=9995 RepID=A0A5E4BAM6_MARMO|nr:hypothetical protein GHT09_009584 [Marmota monax]VTJ65929.1 Hypothetical predicted protein [Marmota monax]
MFSLVFVSVKLSGEPGTHLSPSLREKPSWLMALGVATGNSGFQIHLLEAPTSSSPEQRRVSGRGVDGVGKPGSPLQEPLQRLVVVFLIPLWTTRRPRALSQSLIGLIQTKPQQALRFYPS